jgi:hypothetical protein
MCNEYNGRQTGFKRRAQQVFISKGPQEEAGSWVQGQAEGHTQGDQTGNSTGRGKANHVVREIRLIKRLMIENQIGKSTGRE